MTTRHRDRLDRALTSLTGLSIGDGFGQSLMWEHARIPRRIDPTPLWNWTDDTEMALSVVATLVVHGHIDPDHLAAGFANRHDPGRMYGPAMLHTYFPRVRNGEHWREVAGSLFGGSGSFGNGAAMRVAPLGAWFADDPDRAADEAARQAAVTHAHPEGIAGAAAIASAAALLAADPSTPPDTLMAAIAARTPRGEVRNGLEKALALPASASPNDAAHALGNGSHVTAQDTVPFTVWSAAHHGGSFADTLWRTVSVGGDMDTTAAIVGGVIAPAFDETAIPAQWRAAREPWPEWFTNLLSGE